MVLRTSGPPEDDPVTIRDIYSLVQTLNERTVELVQQVRALTERAQEDRTRFEALASDMQRLKIKVYAAGAAVIFLSTAVVVMEKIAVVSGGM